MNPILLTSLVAYSKIRDLGMEFQFTPLNDNNNDPRSPGTMVTIKINDDILNGAYNIKNNKVEEIDYMYHIHENKVPYGKSCYLAGPVFDPHNALQLSYNNDMYNTPKKCTISTSILGVNNNAIDCMVGDLSGKFGQIKGIPGEYVYLDNALKFDDLFGKSVSVHNGKTKQKVGCSNIDLHQTY